MSDQLHNLNLLDNLSRNENEGDGDEDDDDDDDGDDDDITFPCSTCQYLCIYIYIRHRALVARSGVSLIQCWLPGGNASPRSPQEPRNISIDIAFTPNQKYRVDDISMLTFQTSSD